MPSARHPRCGASCARNPSGLGAVVGAAMRTGLLGCLALGVVLLSRGPGLALPAATPAAGAPASAAQPSWAPTATPLEAARALPEAPTPAADAAVAPAREPAAAPAADALSDTRRRLEALVHGSDPLSEPDLLFTVPLDDLDAVRRRLKALQVDIGQLEAALLRVERSLASLETDLPRPEPPALVVSPPFEPQPPVFAPLTPPVPPPPPPPPAPDAGSTAGDASDGPDGSADAGAAAPETAAPAAPSAAADAGGPAHPDSLAAEDGARAAAPADTGPSAADLAFVEAQAAYEAALVAEAEARAHYQTLFAAFLTQFEAHEQAVREFEWALDTREAALAKRRGQLQAEAHDSRAALTIAGLRRTYLAGLAALLDALPSPARQTFVLLGRPRAALRDKAEAATALAAPLDRLAERLTIVADRAAAGGVVGFRAAREEIEGSLRAAERAVRERATAVRGLGAEMTQKAETLERAGRALRRELLVTVLAPDRQLRIDTRFLAAVGERRRLRRLGGDDAPDDAGRFDAPALTRSLDAAVPRPLTVATTADAERVVAEAQARLEEIDARLGGLRLVLARWDLAYVNPVAQLLEGLASEGTRRNAYSLSRELLADLSAELHDLAGRLATWARHRGRALAELPATLTTQAGLWVGLRFVLAGALLFAWALVRRRLPRIVVVAVRLLVRLPGLRSRVGLVVRLAGVVEAVIGTVALFASAYGVFALLGTERVEVRFAEVLVRWLLTYRLGRLVLVGLTRPVSPGRPAAWPLPPATAALLLRTYARGGLVLAMAAIVDELAREFLGLGVVHFLLMSAVWLWLAAVWGVWATWVWRRPLATAWQTAARPESREARLAAFMGRARLLGLPLCPVALVRLGGAALYRFLRRRLTERGLFTYLRARALKRLARRQGDASTVAPRAALPDAYVREFPLYPLLGEADTALLPRTAQVEQVQEQLRRWREQRIDGSLVLIGEKGSGKTTLMALLSRSLTPLPIVMHTIRRKVTTAAELARDLAPACGLPPDASFDDLVQALDSGPERVILLDEAHNVFLRVIGGFEAFDALVRLVNATSDRVFWVLVFNLYAWLFVNESRKRVHYFRQLLFLPRWTAGELQDLISRRNARSGFTVRFADALLEGPSAGDSGGLQLVETAEGYYRVLAELSRGNPRIATHIWLHSLRPVDQTTLELGLLRQPKAEILNTLDPEMLFALAALCQQENLNGADLARVLNVSYDFAAFTLRFLAEYGIVEPRPLDPERFTLAPRAYTQVIDFLRSRHLLYEAK